MGMLRCKVCRAPTAAYLTCGDTALDRCRSCGVIAQRRIPSQRVLNTYYQGAFYDAAGERFHWGIELLIAFFRRCRARIVMRMAQRGRVLDVGFSRGLMLTALKNQGWESHGITNSRAVLTHGRKIGLSVHYGELPTIRFPPSFFDAITFWHVLEHVREPSHYLRACRRILKPNGVLIIEVPNIGSAIARLFACRWFGLDLPRHLFHFTPASLTRLLAREGFVVQRISYFSLEHSIFSLTQSMLNAFTGQTNAAFTALKKNSLSPSQRMLPLLALPLLLPFASLLSLIAAACGQGDIMRVYSRRK